MTNNLINNSTTESGIQPEDGSDQFVIGADVIAYLIPVKHPLIMVDRIINYHSFPLSLIAERYISANEPVFIGHFPNMKLWPGVYTLEGLRQACWLLEVLNKLDKADLLIGLTELHDRQVLRPKINHELCRRVIDFLKTIQSLEPSLFSMRVKLLDPVFAGTLVRYQVIRNDQVSHGWSVNATVEGKLIAKGSIIGHFTLD
jgi:3-hydroxymyristoyl/3-hydroxydecanoyl-(acyl carrier protein) dehydratase